MPLKAQINDDLKAAMKAKDALRVDCLRSPNSPPIGRNPPGRRAPRISRRCC